MAHGWKGRRKERSEVFTGRQSLPLETECSEFLLSPRITNFEPSEAGRSWKGRRKERSAVFTGRQSLPVETERREFLPPPRPQLRAQQGGSKLERKKEGAECSFHGKAKPARGNGTARVSSAPASPTSSPARRVEVGKEEGTNLAQFSQKALAFCGNGAG